MTNATDHGVRRYSDLLTTGYIKTGADGRKIFYPWGIFGNGYAFPSNDAYERLNDLLKIFTVVALAIIMPVAVPGNYIAAIILAALSLIFYVVWISFEVRKLQRTDEKMTYGEGYTNLARLMPGGSSGSSKLHRFCSSHAASSCSSSNPTGGLPRSARYSSSVCARWYTASC